MYNLSYCVLIAVGLIYFCWPIPWKLFRVTDQLSSHVASSPGPPSLHTFLHVTLKSWEGLGTRLTTRAFLYGVIFSCIATLIHIASGAFKFTLYHMYLGCLSVIVPGIVKVITLWTYSSLLCMYLVIACTICKVLLSSRTLIPTLCILYNNCSIQIYVYYWYVRVAMHKYDIECNYKLYVCKFAHWGLFLYVIMNMH